MDKSISPLIKALCLLVLFTIIISCKQKSKVIRGEIQFLLGAVTINGQEAGLKTQVNDGDVLETGAQSIVRILMGDKTLIQIKENSRLVYKLESENTLQLDRGWMSGFTKGKLIKDEYLIKTPTSLAAVRGTAYCLKVESPESTYFCTCNGTIYQHAVGNEEHAEDVVASHHAARRYIKEGDSYSVEAAGLEYHTDKDIEELAVLIDEEVDWYTSY